jgi:hypothetical protein
LWRKHGHGRQCADEAGEQIGKIIVTV